jgi:hypothetical protein
MAKDDSTGRKVTAEDFETIHRTRPETCPRWSYTTRPRPGAEKTA